MPDTEVTLASGRRIYLERLIQSLTYCGLLEGTPDKRCNDTQIESAIKEARQYPHSMGEPLLIDPVRRDHGDTPGDMQHILDRQRDFPPEMRRIPEWLPDVQCIGVFGSFQPARDATMHCSSLTVIWYQNDFGFDKSAVPQLLDVDWDTYGVDGQY